MIFLSIQCVHDPCFNTLIERIDDMKRYKYKPILIICTGSVIQCVPHSIALRNYCQVLCVVLNIIGKEDGDRTISFNVIILLFIIISVENQWEAKVSLIL